MQLGKRAAALLLALFLLAGNALSPVTAYALDTGQETVTEETTAQTQSTGTGMEEPTETLPETSLNETEVTEAASEPPASSEATGPIDAPAETTEATAPVNTTEATEPLETTEATAETAAATTQATEPVEMAGTLTACLDSRGAEIRYTLADGEALADTLTVAEADPDGAVMEALMDRFGILAILDYCCFTVNTETDLGGGIMTLRFPSPSIMAIDSGSVYIAEIRTDGTMYLIGNADTIVNESNRVESIGFTLPELSGGSTFVILTADWPNIASCQTYPELTVRASGTPASGIGASLDGGLTYHTWDAEGNHSPSKPAICLDSNRVFASGGSWKSCLATSNYIEDKYKVSYKEGGSPNKSWTSLDEDLREKLIYLVCYGLSDWAETSKYLIDGNNVKDGNIFAAMQLVAWEWINGVSEGTYTSHYNSTVQEIAKNLRDLCDKNPDNIDPANSWVYVIWPGGTSNGSWGQELISLQEYNFKVTTGGFTVTKGVNGTGSVSSWKMELYSSYSEALNGTGSISYAYTATSGIATFDDLTPGTYYVREAPASRQDGVSSTAGWTISNNILSGTVTAGNTTDAGTITNTSPAMLSVQKAISPASMSTSENLQNWRFELYMSQASANAGGDDFAQVAYTDASGVATFTGLTPNVTYYIREAPASRQNKRVTTGWTLSDTVLSGAGSGGAITPLSLGTITNYYPGRLIGSKSVYSASGTTGKLSGWVYQISTDSSFRTLVATVTSGSDGSWDTGYILTQGTYYVREAPIESQTRSDKNNFVVDTTVTTVTVTAGGTATAYKAGTTHTSQNVEKGRITVKKTVTGITANSSSLSGWIFYVYSNSALTYKVATITTGSDGTGTSGRLPPGTYYVKEAPKAEQTRADKDYWACDETVTTVTIVPGATASAYVFRGSTANNFYGKYIKLIKAASDPDCYEQIKDNAMYSLAGAEYQITASDGTTETVVTGTDGAVISANLYNVGTTGTIQETKAPNGFLLDSTVYTWEILADSSEYCVVNVTDKPIFDPPFAITKVDKDTTTAQGNSSFSGAVFKWEYFDNTDWSGTPKRTWYFQTNANDIAKYDSSCLASGYTSDDLYVNSSGIYSLPLGTVKITEIKSSLGYIVIQQPLYVSVVEDSSSPEGATPIWTPESWNIMVDIASGNYGVYEPADSETFGSLSIQKLDKDSGTTAPTWASFADCEFTVYNRSNGPVKVGDYAVAQPGEACYTLTADEAGKASTGNVFPIGTYEVRETKGNDYYQCNVDWSFTFTITGTETNPAYAAECANTMYPATINLQKAGTDGQPLPGARFALEWSEDGTTWKPVTKSDDIVMGGCSSPELDENGCLTIGEDGTASFTGLYPVVYYRITEVETPNGYQLLKDPILVDKLLPEDNFEISYRVVNNDVFTLPKTGGFGFWMILPAFGLASVALFFGIFAGTKKRED